MSCADYRLTLLPFQRIFHIVTKHCIMLGVALERARDGNMGRKGGGANRRSHRGGSGAEKPGTGAAAIEFQAIPQAAVWLRL